MLSQRCVGPWPCYGAYAESTARCRPPRRALAPGLLGAVLAPGLAGCSHSASGAAPSSGWCSRFPIGRVLLTRVTLVCAGASAPPGWAWPRSASLRCGRGLARAPGRRRAAPRGAARAVLAAALAAAQPRCCSSPRWSAARPRRRRRHAALPRTRQHRRPDRLRGGGPAPAALRTAAHPSLRGRRARHRAVRGPRRPGGSPRDLRRADARPRLPLPARLRRDRRGARRRALARALGATPAGAARRAGCSCSAAALPASSRGWARPWARCAAPRQLGVLRALPARLQPDRGRPRRPVRAFLLLADRLRARARRRGLAGLLVASLFETKLFLWAPRARGCGGGAAAPADESRAPAPPRGRSSARRRTAVAGREGLRRGARQGCGGIDFEPCPGCPRATCSTPASAATTSRSRCSGRSRLADLLDRRTCSPRSARPARRRRRARRARARACRGWCARSAVLAEARQRRPPGRAPLARSAPPPRSPPGSPSSCRRTT